MLGAQPLGDDREKPIDLRHRQYLGQRPPRHRPGQRGGGIVGAQPLLLQKAVKGPQRRRLARDGGRRQFRPLRRQPAQRFLVRACKACGQQRRRAGQIGAIGEQRVARHAALRRHHFEETVDQGGVVLPHRQARLIASAAIIRASGSSPTRWSAATI
jgi:hypothetical protein